MSGRYCPRCEQWDLTDEVAELQARLDKAIHWAEHAMLMYSYQNKELLGILRGENKTPNAK